MESQSITLRLPPSAVAALAELGAATGGVIPRHKLAVEALTRGARALLLNPSALFAAGALPSSPSPAAPSGGRRAGDAPASAPTVAPSVPPPPLAPAGEALAPRAPAPRPPRPPPPPPPPPPPVEALPDLRGLDVVTLGDRAAATPEDLATARRVIRRAFDARVSVRRIAAAAGGDSGSRRGRVAALAGEGEPPAMRRGALGAIVRAAVALTSSGSSGAEEEGGDGDAPEPVREEEPPAEE